MQKNLPKVLILSGPFMDGDAITILNFFSRWPKESMFCITTHGKDNICNFNEMYILGDKELHLQVPFNFIESIHESEIVSEPYDIKIGKFKHGLKYKLYCNILRPFLQLFNLYEFRIKYKLSNQLFSWIEKISPDFIYSPIGFVGIGNLLIDIHNSFPTIPIVIHGFDDWITPTYRNIFRSSFISKAEKILIKNLDIASLLLSTTDKMSKEYGQRYKKNFITFHNPATLTTADEIYSTNKDVTYIGKIWLHNADAIKDFINAILKYNESNDKITFNIYTNTSLDTLNSLGIKSSNSVIIHPPVSNIEIPNILSRSGALLLPISINKQATEFAKYSMSTKMGEYMASRRPIIYYGPKNIAMTEFIQRENVAFCLLERDINKLITVLEKIFSNPDNYCDMVNNAYCVAKERFDKKIVSANFQKCIIELISQK